MADAVSPNGAVYFGAGVVLSSDDFGAAAFEFVPAVVFVAALSKTAVTLEPGVVLSSDDFGVAVFEFAIVPDVVFGVPFSATFAAVFNIVEDGFRTSFFFFEMTVVNSLSTTFDAAAAGTSEW